MYNGEFHSIDCSMMICSVMIWSLQDLCCLNPACSSTECCVLDLLSILLIVIFLSLVISHHWNMQHQNSRNALSCHRNAECWNTSADSLNNANSSSRFQFIICKLWQIQKCYEYSKRYLICLFFRNRSGNAYTLCLKKRDPDIIDCNLKKD